MPKSGGISLLNLRTGGISSALGDEMHYMDAMDNMDALLENSFLGSPSTSVFVLRNLGDEGLGIRPSHKHHGRVIGKFLLRLPNSPIGMKTQSS